MRIALVVALVGSALATSVARADSVLGPWEATGSSVGAIVGDGQTVAWEDGAGRVQLRGVAPVASLGVPATCVGGLAAVGMPRLLFFCREGLRGTIRVINAATGASRTRPFGDNWYGAGGQFPQFDRIGSHWLIGRYEGNHSADVMLFNWRTGKSMFGAQDPFSARAYLDLSRSSLGRRLCSAIRRTRARGVGDESVPRYRPLIVRGNDVLRGARGTGGLHGHLSLQRCGARQRITLGPGSQATLGGGWVTWTAPEPPTDHQVRARRIADGATFRSTDLPQNAVAPFRLIVVHHTADGIYASVRDASQPATVLQTPLPR